MRFYKTKPFILSVTVAIALVTVSGLMALLGVTAPLKNAVATAAMPFQWCANKIATAADGLISYFTEFDDIQAENEQLRRELAEARDQLHRAEQAEEENAFLREYLALPEMESNLSLTDAQIVARSSGNAEAVYTLNRGSLHGIEVGMPVITADGLVGCVDEVGINWCRVTSILAINASAGAYDERSGELGVAEGTYELQKRGLCRLAYLEEGADIAIGDRIVTSGYGSIYPQGLVIGTVTEVQADRYTRAKIAVIQPAVDFTKLTRVMIVTDCTITPVDAAEVTQTNPTKGGDGLAE